MPIKTIVESSEVGGSMQLTATMKDTPGSGGWSKFIGNVVFVCDAKGLAYKHAFARHPGTSEVLTPFLEDTEGADSDADGMIELWWRLEFTPAQPEYEFHVDLKPVESSEGPWDYAWTTVSTDATPSDYHTFDGRVGTFHVAASAGATP